MFLRWYAVVVLITMRSLQFQRKILKFKLLFFWNPCCSCSLTCQSFVWSWNFWIVIYPKHSSKFSSLRWMIIQNPAKYSHSKYSLSLPLVSRAYSFNSSWTEETRSAVNTRTRSILILRRADYSAEFGDIIWCCRRYVEAINWSFPPVYQRKSSWPSHRRKYI